MKKYYVLPAKIDPLWGWKVTLRTLHFLRWGYNAFDYTCNTECKLSILNNGWQCDTCSFCKYLFCNSCRCHSIVCLNTLIFLFYCYFLFNWKNVQLTFLCCHSMEIYYLICYYLLKWLKDMSHDVQGITWWEYFPFEFLFAILNCFRK